MDMSPNPIPAGFHTVTPFVALKEAKRTLEFYAKAFDAIREFEKYQDDGTLMHATIRLGDSVLMCSDTMTQTDFSPHNIDDPKIALWMYVSNVDEVYRRAVAAGALSRQVPMDAFWGDRIATIQDPSDIVWHIASHKEDVSPEELDARANAFYQHSSSQVSVF